MVFSLDFLFLSHFTNVTTCLWYLSHSQVWKIQNKCSFQGRSTESKKDFNLTQCLVILALILHFIMPIQIFYSCIYSFPNALESLSSRFNVSIEELKNPLLCFENDYLSQSVVYDLYQHIINNRLPVGSHWQSATLSKVLLTDPGFSTGASTGGVGGDAYCFAGLRTI